MLSVVIQRNLKFTWTLKYQVFSLMRIKFIVILGTGEIGASGGTLLVRRYHFSN